MKKHYIFQLLGVKFITEILIEYACIPIYKYDAQYSIP